MSDVDLLRDGLVRFPQDGRPAENPALGEWLAEARAAGWEPTERGDGPAVEGPCQRCGTRPAVRACLSCGQPVCREDLWTMMGICRVCTSENEAVRARDIAAQRRPDLGLKWVED